MTTKTPAAPKSAQTAAVAATPAAKPARTAPIIVTGALPEGFTPPAKPTRGGGAGAPVYPFDSLEVGGMFSVKNKNARGLVAPVSRANKRFRNELKGADGATTTAQEREFYAVDVDAATAAQLVGTPHEGATALVVRSK